MYLIIIIACGILPGTSGVLLPMAKPDDTVDLRTVIDQVTLLEQSLANFHTKTTQLESEVQSTKTELQRTRTELLATKTELHLLKSSITSVRQNISMVEKTSILTSQSLAQFVQQTVESNVSFNVYINDSMNTDTSYQPLKFDSVNHNTGCYNTTTGKFTAPVPGTYIFSTDVFVYTTNNGKTIFVRIVKSGSVINAGYGETTKDYNSITIPVTAVTHLDQGQQVWVTAGSDILVYGQDYTSYFVGALVSVG